MLLQKQIIASLNKLNLISRFFAIIFAFLIFTSSAVSINTIDLVIKSSHNNSQIKSDNSYKGLEYNLPNDLSLEDLLSKFFENQIGEEENEEEVDSEVNYFQNNDSFIFPKKSILSLIDGLLCDHIIYSQSIRSSKQYLLYKHLKIYC